MGLYNNSLMPEVTVSLVLEIIRPRLFGPNIMLNFDYSQVTY